ncbi:uncharacterized protein LOC122022359 isoform X4 [Zingiber officinale]|uniref:uncharacterized protein LOC122022359 isoform X4 n=1 Tax=Zingiber officinale TaxID=94328 RepID=UPI001C4C4D58|nr:uncharacterized protein LOC122022359 isoform X4 [Zingiber officinale]
MEKAAAVLVLLAVAMGATASGVKDQQCAANLLPCSQYLNATGKPPESCCRVFRNEHQGLPVRQRLRRHQPEHLRLFRSDASSSAITTRSFSFRRDYLFQELHRAADELAFLLVDRCRVKLL